MADDVAGAVRRTPRPYPSTDDHQTPETVAQPAAGTTNDPTPVSTDAGNGTDDLRAELIRVITTARPNVIEAAAIADALLAAGWQAPALDEARVNAAAWGFDTPEYAALPECTACEGTGKDDHATVFEAPLAVHFAGPPVRAERRLRQLCMWCGHVLIDASLKDEIQLTPWTVGVFVKVEDSYGVELPHEPGAELPPGCCALPDDGEPVCICSVESTPCPDCRDEDQADDDEPVDPDDGYPVDLCGKHTGNCSNRCLLPAHHDGECDDDPRPDEAQETRAAADWPAEEVTS